MCVHDESGYTYVCAQSNDNVCVCSMRVDVCAQWGCVLNESGCVCSMTMYVCAQ